MKAAGGEREMQNDYLWWNHLVDSGAWGKLSSAAKAIVGVLVRRVDATWGCFMRDATVWQEAGICRSGYYQAKRELERLRLLTSSTDGRKSYFTLHLPANSKRPATPPRSTAVHAVHKTTTQKSVRTDFPTRHSIAVLTDPMNSSAPPAVPAEAAAVLARLRKNKVRPAKAAEWAATYPLPVLLWLCGRLERKKPDNPTGFCARLLAEEGAQRARAAAAEIEESRQREEEKRRAEEAKSKERSAAEDVDAMVRRAWEALTPAQRIGLHIRAAAMSPLASSRRRLQQWSGGPPAAVALALLRADLAGTTAPPPGR